MVATYQESIQELSDKSIVESQPRIIGILLAIRSRNVREKDRRGLGKQNSRTTEH